MALTQFPFYLTLPSDTSIDVFPLNNASVWVTKLSRPISLQGRWEVALVELTYPQTMYNVHKKQQIVVNQLVQETLSDGTSRPANLEETISVPPGIYSPDQLIAHIEKYTPPLRDQEGVTMGRKAFDIFTHSSERKTRVHFSTLRVWLRFPEKSKLLQQMLGFSSSTVGYDTENSSYDIEVTPEQQMKALLVDNRLADQLDLPHPPQEYVDLSYTVVSGKAINTYLGSQSLFIQCDLAELSVVGDTWTPLLRTVPIKADSAFQLVQVRYDKPHYVPISKTTLDTIRIEITNDLGEDVKFNSGKSMIKLHCRPSRLD